MSSGSRILHTSRKDSCFPFKEVLSKEWIYLRDAFCFISKMSLLICKTSRNIWFFYKRHWRKIRNIYNQNFMLHPSLLPHDGFVKGLCEVCGAFHKSWLGLVQEFKKDHGFIYTCVFSLLFYWGWLCLLRAWSVSLYLSVWGWICATLAGVLPRYWDRWMDRTFLLPERRAARWGVGEVLKTLPPSHSPDSYVQWNLSH